MATKTTNLGLNTWLENDGVDFEEINENFTKIDSLPICCESGTKTAYYSGGTDANSAATWHYKKYTDGTVEMSTQLSFVNLKCNGGSAAPYNSGECTVTFPFVFADIYDVQLHLASNTRGWIVDVTGQTILDKLRFIILAMSKETTEIYKQVYVNIKGIISN